MAHLQRAAGNRAVTGLVAWVQRQSVVRVQRQKTRTAAELDAAYQAAVAAGQWALAAENLNGFDDAGIASRVAGLNHDQLIWLYTAALGSMSGISQRRILDPIARRDLDAAYQACVRTARWEQAATLLNGFNDADIATRAAALSPEQVQRMLAATPAGMARVRAALLDVRYQAAVAAGQWAVAAENLNGFNDADIIARLRALSIDQSTVRRMRASRRMAATTCGRRSRQAENAANSPVGATQTTFAGSRR
jgi:hypothetical protein